MNSDDNEPTAGVGDVNDTAVVADSPRTVAAETHSEPPTTVVPDVGPTQVPDLAWSSESDTEELSDHGRGWRGRLLWAPLVALLCASVAVVVWFSITLYRQHHPVAAPPTAPPPVAAPPVPAEPSPVAPIAPPSPVAPPTAAPAPPPPTAAQSNITPQQANTICRWLRDPSWTMPQIESSTGDMLADDNPSFKGTPDVFKAIAGAMSSTCPDVANQRPF